MLRYARQIIRFTSGKTVQDLLSNEQLMAAMLYSIMILGEASRRVSPEFRNHHPQIPWREVTGIRSVIVHEYQRVDMNEIWNVCTRDVPALIPQPEHILKDYPI